MSSPLESGQPRVSVANKRIYPDLWQNDFGSTCRASSACWFVHPPRAAEEGEVDEAVLDALL